MRIVQPLGFAAAAAVMLASSAHAEDRGFAHFSVSQTGSDPGSVKMLVAGTAVPGADYSVSTENGVAAEFGWRVYGDWAVALSVNSEVETKNVGKGSLAAVTDIGSDSFRLMALSGQYHYRFNDHVEPYAGAGFAYFDATGTKDGMVTNLAVADSSGPMLQLGADFRVNERWGAFIDAKKYFIAIDATGDLGGAPVAASADLDPLQFSAGLSYHF